MPSPPVRFWRRRIGAFACAIRGVGLLLRGEPHARVHLVAMVGAIVISAALKLDRAGWAMIVVAIGLVFATEAANAAIERLADRVSRERHPLLRDAKDLAAASVLLAAAAALALGALAWAPGILRLIGGM